MDAGDIAMSGSRAIGFIAKEFREALPPILFFFVTFNLVELTTQLILAEYLERLANFMVATTMALVVGKAVLVADALPFLRRFDAGPMIRPILFKTVVYWAVVFVARLLEEIVEYRISDGAFAGTWRHLIEHFSWHRFAAIQIWIFVLFLVYTFIAELNVRLGNGELARMVFERVSAKPSVA
jgi:hypothetical protein